jgi:hypothetical protein
MAEDFPFDDSFVLMFPCFAVMNNACNGGMVIEKEDGRVGLVLLTDEDLLASYRTQHNLLRPRYDLNYPGKWGMGLKSARPAQVQ